jgi:RHS repeat-associated protein
MNSKESTATNQPNEHRFSPPSVSLPKGGGAIKGIGEKFAANPVTGTGSMTIPLPLSPGRSGFAPTINLSYDSGAGNGPFGFGWSVGLPAITRRTDRGLPQYFDREESDVFILSGAEDLVPDVNQDERTRNGYRVLRYRPRIEGLFARIERWTKPGNPSDTFWRSISRDNVTTVYGKTVESRIVDPDNSSRIFSWLMCQSHDDKGNAIVYEYEEENSNNIVESQVHEKNRTAASRRSNRYLKRVRYGNRKPNRDLQTWQARDPDEVPDQTWMFEVVFDYGEGHYSEADPDAEGRIFAHARLNPAEDGHWPVRPDPFSSYRAGFEVRTYRLCQRVLMFHHFPNELGTPDYLVRSTQFNYELGPIASFITEATQSGYVRQLNGTYLKKSFPPINLEYSKAEISKDIETLDSESLENLPAGVDGLQYQWVDLDGEGLQGILSEQLGAWYYKRNLSPISTAKLNGTERVVARLAAVAEVETLPSIAQGGGKRHQFLDLAGDGSLDVVQLEKPDAGFFERTDDERWKSFIAFNSLPNLAWNDPNLKFIDLTGDGHADILITEDSALTWYPSLAERGFEKAIRIPHPLDEEKGPAVVFADGTETVAVADLSGDGLTDIIRIRNGEICYWPNLGYGRFGAKVTMDNAPRFDTPDQFDQKRVRLADIDGSGTTDIIYLERHRVAIYRNECGNAWSAPEYLDKVPAVDDVSSVTAVDVLGNGTACLVWSSPLPGNAHSPMRYIDLMGGLKPHLLRRVTNNLGAETIVDYAPSTKFYLADKLAGKPWITRLPFPVHVVERVETRDLISRNRFVTRYRYHHGYFDGVDREFRGFGMVEQFDTEELASLQASDQFGEATNIDATSYVPPVFTKTWFHTGAYLEDERISTYFEHEYYHEGDESGVVEGLSHEQLHAMLLPDTRLPARLKLRDGSIPCNLTVEEIREAYRSLKGSILRQEVYANDGSDEADRPYTASERNYTIELLQPQGHNKNAVFFVHPREAIEFHYERKLFAVGGKRVADPRVTHAMTLEVDAFGNVLESVAIGYGRRHGEAETLLNDEDLEKQKKIFVTYTRSSFTEPIDLNDDYRAPLPSEAITYQLIELPKILPERNQPGVTNFFTFEEMLGRVRSSEDDEHQLAYENLEAVGALPNQTYRRPIEHVRTLYRKNDLTSLLPLGEMEFLALPGEAYKLVFTRGLAQQTFVASGKLTSDKLHELLGDSAKYVHSEGDTNWWIPSGRVFYSSGRNDTPAEELEHAREHFFLPRRYRDPFHTDQFRTETVVSFDDHNLLVLETVDALENAVRAENDYRVLSSRLMTDANRNRSEVAFDALGMVAGTAVMGSANQEGDLLDDFFATDLLQADLNSFLAGPCEPSVDGNHTIATSITRKLLAKATTRIVYDLDRFSRSGEPPFAATLARETHFREPNGDQSKIQISFSYSDGFGREIQRKIQAEPGPLDEDSQDVNPRWVGSGWTIFNNKGRPVRQYEPFFSTLPDNRHQFEFARKEGVSPILFYDPVERVVATLHPNHTWEKVVFDPWQQTTYDVNDTLTIDPRTDENVKEFFRRLPEADYLPTWNELRTAPAYAGVFAQHYPEAEDRANETAAAIKSKIHANTPGVTYFDALGRALLTVAHNKFKYSNTPAEDPPIEEFYSTRIVFDIEGNQREVIDAKDRVVTNRIVMRYDNDMLGNQIHQASMEAGERWVLNDVSGKPIRAWDSRGHMLRTEYDQLRRPIESWLSDGAEAEVLIGRTVYGETRANPESANLRGKVVQTFDQAGVVTSDKYDFKGNLLNSQRQFAGNYKTVLDWSSTAATVPLEDEIFTSSTRYDALNRPVEATAPHTPDMKTSILRPTYNEANLLERVEVNLLGATIATTFVSDIDYDAKGQRQLIVYGNRAQTNYEYDPLTFRLIRLRTTRPVGSNALSSKLFTDPAVVQDLHYTCDPAENIATISDTALARLSPGGTPDNTPSDYVYDAIYRLIEATGREHIGQTTHDFNPPEKNGRDYPFTGLANFTAHPNDLQAMRRYTERYEYDAVGNFEFMRHSANGGSWTLSYDYEEKSLLDAVKVSNRLTRTRLGNSLNHTETYSYKDSLGRDVHGCMTAMNSMKMLWDFKDELKEVDLGGGGTAYYVYDAGGQRARKVIETQNGVCLKERIYLGGFEIYREFDDLGSNVNLQRETLHVMDDKQRIALVETKTVENGNTIDSPVSLQRYQLGNHLGSSVIELDHDAQLISYEEYHPYGTTSFQAGRSAAEISLKRYRYVGRERDDETGLAYHGARYYAPWFGRWTATDPLGMEQGPNLYQYGRDNPIIFRDLDGMEVIPGESTGNESPEEIRAIARNAGFGFKRLPTYSKELGMWDFGENNLYKLTTRFKPGEAKTIPSGPYSTNPRSGDSYDLSHGNGKQRGGGGGSSAGGKNTGGKGSPHAGTSTSGTPNAKPTSSITGPVKQTGSGGGPGSGNDSGGGGEGSWDWLPEVMGDILLVVTLTLAMLTVIGWAVEFAAALKAGLTLVESAQLATWSTITGVSATGAGAAATTRSKGGGPTVITSEDLSVTNPYTRNYQLVDELGESVYPGETMNVEKTLWRHAGEKGLNWRGMQIISEPYSKPQGLALEQSIGEANEHILSREVGSLYKLGGNWDPTDIWIPPTKHPSLTLLNPSYYPHLFD